MPYARYKFRTSNFNWNNGILLLLGAAFCVWVRPFARGGPMLPFVIAGVMLLLSVACFLARYDLSLDVQAGHVKDTAGFWPFARTRYEWVSDFTGMEITYITGSRGAGHYTLWLLAKDGRQISLADSSTWSRLNNRAQELSQATGWPVTDLTNGRSGLSSLLGL